MRRFPFAPLFALAGLTALSACGHYDGPPRVTLAYATDGLLQDTTAPIVLSFSKPVDPKTLKVFLAKFAVDEEGNLADEDDSEETTLDPIFIHKPDDDIGGTAVVAKDGRSLTLTPMSPPPAGGQLVLLIEPGLSDFDGHATIVRKRIVFGYDVKVECDKPSEVFAAGAYFMLVDVEKPIGAQVQLFASIEVNAETGAFRGQFTNADRIKDPNRCPMKCTETEVCRLLPEPACVAPSERAASTEEFSDYFPNNSPPTGFSFLAPGCAVDEPDGSVLFASSPVDIEVASPAVTLRNTELIAAFTRDKVGILRGTGSLTADDVLLGKISSGRGEGSISMRSIPKELAPEGLPGPVAEEEP